MPENSLHIAYALLVLSFFTNLISSIVGIWDRVRLKPTLIERLTGYVSLPTFSKFESEIRAELKLMAPRTELMREVDLIDDRITSLHRSYKETDKTTQAVLRDLIRQNNRGTSQ